MTDVCTLQKLNTLPPPSKAKAGGKPDFASVDFNQAPFIVHLGVTARLPLRLRPLPVLDAITRAIARTYFKEGQRLSRSVRKFGRPDISHHRRRSAPSAPIVRMPPNPSTAINQKGPPASGVATPSGTQTDAADRDQEIQTVSDYRATRSR